MSGPRTIKVPTDGASIVAPAIVAKNYVDTTMVVFDFSRWLGPDQTLTGVSDLFILANPDASAGVWFPFPGGCCSSNDAPSPADTNPLILSSIGILPLDRTKIEFAVSAGTPNLAYLASFVAAAGPIFRAKEVGVIMSCYATHPLPPPLPPPAPGTPITIVGTGTLPAGAQGSISINNGSAAPITITLPPNPVLDQTLRFKDVAGNASSYPIRIKQNGVELIDAGIDYYLYQDYQAIELYWTGSKWGIR